MQAKLWSLNGLAVELGANLRTLARALTGIPADGVTDKGRPGWLVSTGLRALAARSGNSPATAEIERHFDAVEAALARLRKIPNLAQRRELALSAGFNIPAGPLDQAMERAAEGLPEHEKLLLDLSRGRIIGILIGEVLGLLEWQMPEAA